MSTTVHEALSTRDGLYTLGILTQVCRCCTSEVVKRQAAELILRRGIAPTARSSVSSEVRRCLACLRTHVRSSFGIVVWGT